MTTEPFLQEDDPFISIDLRGYECETVKITVAFYGGEDEEGQLVNATLLKNETPSMLILVPWQRVNLRYTPRMHTDNMCFRRGVHVVETSLYDDGTVREAEVTFTVSLFFRVICKNSVSLSPASQTV